MPAFAQGIAARDPACGKERAFAGAMTRDGFECVVRTRGIKAALRAKHGTEQPLISAYACG